MQTGTQNRGFASMDRDRQREIARKGGKAAHEKGTAHEFTADEARSAGRKGGERVSADRAHMSRIGRLGGKSSAGRRNAPELGRNGEEVQSHSIEATDSLRKVGDGTLASDSVAAERSKASA
jgi:general stress protein YciG